jgi:anti-sigma B factor antagonist
MSEPLAVVGTTEHQGRPLVRVEGEVDISNADSVGEQIRAAGGPAAAVVLDLGAVQFFDSRGLRMLVLLAADLEAAGGRLTVVAPPESIVGRLLTLTALDTRLQVLAALPT